LTRQMALTVAENAFVCSVTILLRLAEREKLTTEARKHGDKTRRDFVKFELDVPLCPNLTKRSLCGRKTSLPEPRRAQLGVGQGDLSGSFISALLILQ